METRFNGKVPHYIDNSLLERCQEELRNYNIYSNYVEPRDHTMSYIAAAYLELAKKYDELLEKSNKEVAINGY